MMTAGWPSGTLWPINSCARRNRATVSAASVTRKRYRSAAKAPTRVRGSATASGLASSSATGAAGAATGCCGALAVAAAIGRTEGEAGNRRMSVFESGFGARHAI